MSWKQRYETFNPGDKVRFVRFTNPFGEVLRPKASQSYGILRKGDILTLKEELYKVNDTNPLWITQEHIDTPNGRVFESEIEKVEE
jgi:hypothetical protein